MSVGIEVQEAWRTYPGATPVHALRGVSLSVQAGELVAIVGPSGSGKSTLLGLLGCLDVPTRGSVLVDGVDAAHLGDAERSRLRRARLGFVFQQFHLIAHLSAAENVATALLYRGFSRSRRHSMASAALERVGLGARAGHRPTQLSGGEQQRVAIARAIAGGASILLADEPTGNLDTENSDSIFALLATVAEQGAAVILVTHDTRLAGKASRQVELSDGRLAGPTAAS